MLQQPILTIDKFSGTGDGRLLYNEGFLPEVINGKSVMTSGLTSNTLLGGGSLYGDLTLNNIVSTINLKTLDNNQTDYFLARNTSGKIFSSSLVGDTIKKAEIRTGLGGGYPDMFEIFNSSIIYTNGNYLGYGLRGQTTGGSTTTLVDTTKNFTDLGFDTNDKVTNLKTGATYTITSITTTTNANDTLNFSTSGTLTTASGNEYIVWDDEKYNLLDNVSVENWQGGATTDWRRQMAQWGNQYFILNGNYLAKLSTDGVTLEDNNKQLPNKHQALSISVNNDKILISADYKGVGKLLLWDGFSDGWNNILDFDFPINALVPYQSNWLFVSRGTLYLTDGYQIQKISSLDNRNDINRFVSGVGEPLYFNGLFYHDNRLYFANSYNDYNFIDYGVYCYDFKTGWTLIKQTSGENIIRLNGIPYCINYCNYKRNIMVGGDEFINEIRSHKTYNNGEANYSFIYYINLPKPTRITGIGLNLIRPVKDYLEDAGIKQSTIAINIGDGNRGLIDRVYNSEASGSSNDNIIKVNGTLFYNNEIGDEIRIKDISSGNNLYGERRYISNITNKGEATEQWTLDSDLSSDLGLADQIQMFRLKKMDKITVYSNNLAKEFLFTNPSAGFLSNKLFIEVVVWDSYDYTPMPISILDIKIYGD